MKTNGKKSIFILILAFVVFCTFTPGGAFAGSSKPIKLKVVTYLSPSYGDTFYACQQLVDYIKLYGKKYNLDAELFHSQTVYKAKEMLSACMSGNVDIIITNAPYVQGTIPAFGATDLPFIWKDTYAMREGVRRGSPYFNYISGECDKRNIVLLSMASTTPAEIISKKPLHNLEDMKGIKVRVSGAAFSMAIKTLGAKPVSMPSSEVYTSLQRGVIDAAMVPDITVKSRKLHEVAKFQLNLGAFLYDWPTMINKVKFNNFTQDQKNVILNAAEIYRHAFSTSEFLGDYRHLRQINRDYFGVQQFYLPADDLKKVQAATEPVYNWWKKKVGTSLAEQGIKAIKDSHDWRKAKYGRLELIPIK